MPTISSTVSFASNTEADSVNSDEDIAWEDADEEQKTAALISATIYLQSNYSCGIYSSGQTYTQADVPQVLKDASSILANEHLTLDIFARQDNNGPVEETEVKAGSVATRKRYKVNASGTWVDPFPFVTSILAGRYPLKAGNGRIVSLTRR